jgi:hypothetical protein
MLTPIHNNFTTPTLFKAVGSGKHGNDRGLTLGFERLRIQDELPLPSVSPLQRVTMAILCAKQVCTYPAWCEWADAWIKGDFDSRRAILVLQRCHISVGANIAQGKNWIGESDGVVAGRAACRAAIWTRERTLWVSETKFEAAVAVARAATVLNPDIGPQQLARKPNLRNRMLDLPALMKRAMEIGDAEHI